MSIISFIQESPWAILPEKFDAIHQAALINTSIIESRLERKSSVSPGLRVEAGVAVLDVYGILAKRMNLVMSIFGGTSTELLGRDFKAALADDDVRAILLDIDSPGGTVDGTETLADMIYNARAKKPIVAFCNGLTASAAYWIASAADQVVSGGASQVGSIGIVMTHYDYSRADEKEGVKRSLIYSGKYKTVGNDTEPLKAGARDVLQRRVDVLYGIFVNRVARFRGKTVQKVLDNMAEGRLFIGRQALAAGLVDRVGNFQSAITTARILSYQTRAAQIKPSTIREEITMEKKDFMTLVEEYKEKKGCSVVDAMKAVRKKDPESYTLYISQKNPHINFK